MSLGKKFLITARRHRRRERTRYTTVTYLDDVPRAEVAKTEGEKRKNKRTGKKEERKIETKKGNGNETKRNETNQKKKEKKRRNKRIGKTAVFAELREILKYEDNRFPAGCEEEACSVELQVGGSVSTHLCLLYSPVL